MYKLIKNPLTSETNQIVLNLDGGKQILFGIDNPNSSNYANFKKEVLAGAELQDAEGQVMTQEQADAFIKELP
jgi:hypothetical protein